MEIWAHTGANSMKVEDVLDEFKSTLSFNLSETGYISMNSLIKDMAPVFSTYNGELRYLGKNYKHSAQEYLSGKVDLFSSNPSYVLQIALEDDRV